MHCWKHLNFDIIDWKEVNIVYLTSLRCKRNFLKEVEGEEVSIKF